MNKKALILSDSEKRRIIKFYQTSGLSKNAVQHHFNIGGHSMIKKWMDQFGIKENLELMKKEKELLSDSKTQNSLDLAARIRELEASLEHEKLRTRAYETMIEIAEKRFQIDIRKKSGTKQ